MLRSDTRGLPFTCRNMVTWKFLCGVVERGVSGTTMYVAPEKINVASMLPKNYWEILKPFHFYFRPLSLGYEEW